MVFRTGVGAILFFSLLLPMLGQVDPRAAEMSLGRRASAEFERRVKLVEDATVAGYIDGIAQKLARNSNVAVPITIKVVDSDEVNAVSFPGGFLYVNSGLILAVDSEAEIAGVVAHEIAHVFARDGMKSGSYIGVAPDSSPVGAPPDGTNENDVYLIPLSSLGSRQEIDADFRGIRYMRRAGYETRAMLTFLQKMQAKEKAQPNTVIRMFQTHPPTTERIRRLLQRALYNNQPGTDTHTDNAVELQKIKELLIHRSEH